MLGVVLRLAIAWQLKLRPAPVATACYNLLPLARHQSQSCVHNAVLVTLQHLFGWWHCCCAAVCLLIVLLAVLVACCCKWPVQASGEAWMVCCATRHHYNLDQAVTTGSVAETVQHPAVLVGHRLLNQHRCQPAWFAPRCYPSCRLCPAAASTGLLADELALKPSPGHLKALLSLLAAALLLCL